MKLVNSRKIMQIIFIKTFPTVTKGSIVFTYALPQAILKHRRWYLIIAWYTSFT